MGTHLRVLGKNYPMNTNMTVVRWFTKIFASLCFERKWPQHWKGKSHSIHSILQHSYPSNSTCTTSINLPSGARSFPRFLPKYKQQGLGRGLLPLIFRYIWFTLHFFIFKNKQDIFKLFSLLNFQGHGHLRFFKYK